MMAIKNPHLKMEAIHDLHFLKNNPLEEEAIHDLYKSK
jgi:hypothetical protein